MAWANLHEINQTLAWTLLHFLWQGLLIGALYAGAKRVSASMRWQHGLALTALLLLLLAPVATYLWLSLQPTQPATALVMTVASTSVVLADAQGAIVHTDEHSLWSYALVGLWLLGALMISLHLLGDWRQVRTAVREGSSPSNELLALLQRQQQRMGLWRTVRLRLTARISTPGVYGWLRPVILLPTALALSLPRDQLETLLIHELAHIRRADFIANLLALLARTLLYFHPVVHWICRDLERSRETLCDDLVVGLQVDPLKYARALSTAEQFRQQVPAPLLTATGGELSARVHRILALDSTVPRDNGRAPLLLALAGIALAVLGLRTTDPQTVLAASRPAFQAAYQALMQAPVLRPALPDTTIAALASKRPVLLVPALADSSAAPTAGVDTTIAVDGSAPEVALVTAPPTMPPAPVLSTPSVDVPTASTLAVAPAAPTISAQAPPVTAVAAPRPLRRIEPQYPQSARWHGVEGSITLSYRIAADGSTTDLRVISAQPAGAFEESALAALARWRFPADAGTAAGEHQQIFEFRLGEESTSRCPIRTGTRICRRLPGRQS